MAETPESLIDEFKAGFLTGDANAMADCYEDDAILVMAALGIVAEGKEAIRETWAGMTAMGQPIDFKIESGPVQVDGELAYAHLVGTALIKSSETGQEDTMDVRATEVMHRGVDGQWRYVIDHA
jgi:uncharacterized protein (TIGR02246 family)